MVINPGILIHSSLEASDRQISPETLNTDGCLFHEGPASTAHLVWLWGHDHSCAATPEVWLL